MGIARALGGPRLHGRDRADWLGIVDAVRRRGIARVVGGEWQRRRPGPHEYEVQGCVRKRHRGPSHIGTWATPPRDFFEAEAEPEPEAGPRQRLHGEASAFLLYSVQASRALRAVIVALETRASDTLSVVPFSPKCNNFDRAEFRRSRNITTTMYNVNRRVFRRRRELSKNSRSWITLQNRSQLRTRRILPSHEMSAHCYPHWRHPLLTATYHILP